MQTSTIKTNSDTTFLKIIGIISMTLDHISWPLFGGITLFKWLGRLAFPIFCYCLTFGLLHTKDIKKYLLRLLAFAIISQPFYNLAFDLSDFILDFSSPNIFFTLFISLFTLWGFKEKKWLFFILGILLAIFLPIDYSIKGIILMLIFYLFRNNRILGILLFSLVYLPAFFNATLETSHALIIGNHAIDFEVFALLAIPFIFIQTDSKLRINKWLFYIYYPLHLGLIFLIKTFIIA